MMGMAVGAIPSVFNHLDGGTFSVTQNGDYDIQLTNDGILFPKGILIWTNDFTSKDAKEDKSFLGSYAALFIMPHDIDKATVTNEWIVLSHCAFYFTNWGQNPNGSNPNARSSRTETRGISYYKESTKQFRLRGFGAGDYDFKLNKQYNWIAWD